MAAGYRHGNLPWRNTGDFGKFRWREIHLTQALPGQGDKLPSELSGGMRKRLALARTVVGKLKETETTLTNLAVTSEQWKDTSLELDPTLMEARAAIQEIRNTATRAEKTLQSADQTLTEIKPVIRKLPDTIHEFSRTVCKAGDALDRMKRGEGLLGTLASDNEVALDAEAFMQNLRQFGIFRYRDGVAKQQNSPNEKAPLNLGSASNLFQ